MADSNHASNPVQIFRDSWATYQKAVDNDYMFHRQIYADLASFLEQRYRGEPFSLLEAGCGDASQTVAALRNCTVSQYRGIDLSEMALEQASSNLAVLSCQTELVLAHMLAGLSQVAEPFDVVFSSFALHHLDMDEKREFFELSRRNLKPNGVLLLTDVMRAPHEDRPAYLQAYLAKARESWLALDSEEFAAVCEHIEQNDFPESALVYSELASAAGFADARRLSQHTWHETWAYQCAV